MREMRDRFAQQCAFRYHAVAVQMRVWNLSQRDVSERSGIALRRVRELARGTDVPTEVEIALLCRVLHVVPEFLRTRSM